jgi:hypothetical protein
MTAAALSYWLDLYWWDFGIGSPAPIGVGVGVGLGFAVGPAATTTPRPRWFAFGQAVRAGLLGLAILAAVWAATALASGYVTVDGAAVAGSVAFTVFAIPVALVFALPVTLPIAFIATGVLRATRDRPRRMVAAIVGVLLATAGITAASAALPRPDLQPAVEFAPVELEWTIANHSRQDLELGVWAESPDTSVGGWTRTVPACFTTTDRSGEQASWFLTLEQPTEDFWGGDVPPALVSAEEVPGADAHVWITVAADGAISVEPGRGAPPDEELAVDHCMMGSRP